MESYDWARWGRFFDQSKLQGQIYFHKLHTDYTVNGKNKGIANEVAIGDGIKQGERSFVYVTHHLKYKGFKYYRDKDGFSPLFVLWDRNKNLFYGAYSPLQSIRQEDKKYLYVIGTPKAPGYIPFPQDPILPQLFYLQAKYYPSTKNSRIGEIFFHVREIVSDDPEDGKELFAGKAASDEKVKVGDYYIAMEEVRYWATMDVYYNPGLPLILTSLWIGLGGIALTTIARLIRKKD